MAENKIENLEELMSNYLGPNKKIVGKEMSNLTAPGDNYMSSMINLDLVIRDQATSKETDLHAVAKCLNVGDDLFDFHKKSSFFENELNFYLEMLPTLKEFQKEQGMVETQIFPELYAARYNLHGKNKEVDEHAVLILENLKTKGYGIGDRHLSFNLKETKMVLESLAEYHAIPLALKIKKPYVFEQRVKVHVKHGGPEGPGKKDEAKRESGDSEASGGPKRSQGRPPNPFKDILEKYESIKPYVDIVNKKVESGKLDIFMKEPKDSPFNTITHQDAWVNNFMQLYENEKLIHNKLVDFQVYSFGSPVRDLLFFLFTSVQIPVLKTYLDELIKYYHTHFEKILHNLKVDTAPYNYYKFLVEVESNAMNELLHIMYFSVIVFGKKNEPAIEINKGEVKMATPTEAAIQRVVYAFEEFGKRGWVA